MRGSDFPDELPEEVVVRELEEQKRALERQREIERRKSAAISKAANLRDDIKKLGGKPIK